jgi:hypothetical protein
MKYYITEADATATRLLPGSRPDGWRWTTARPQASERLPRELDALFQLSEQTFHRPAGDAERPHPAIPKS